MIRRVGICTNGLMTFRAADSERAGWNLCIVDLKSGSAMLADNNHSGFLVTVGVIFCLLDHAQQRTGFRYLPDGNAIEFSANEIFRRSETFQLEQQIVLIRGER